MASLPESFAQIGAVATNTYRDAIRQPVYIVLLLATIALLIVSLSVVAFTLKDDNKLLHEVSLSTLLTASVLLNSLSSIVALSGDLSSRTSQLLLSKPLRRVDFLLGKYLGLAGSTLTTLTIWALIFFITSRHGVVSSIRVPYHEPILVFGPLALGISVSMSALANYRHGRSFASSLVRWLLVSLGLVVVICHLWGPDWQFTPQGVDPTILLATLLIAEAVLILAAISVAIAVRFGPVSSLGLTLVIFALGLTSEGVFGQRFAGEWWANALYILVPNLQYMWLGEAILEGSSVPFSYLSWVSLYAVVYITAILALGTALFASRELK